MTKKVSRPSKVSKEVYDICAAQRDHWKEMSTSPAKRTSNCASAIGYCSAATTT